MPDENSMSFRDRVLAVQVAKEHSVEHRSVQLNTTTLHHLNLLIHEYFRWEQGELVEYDRVGAHEKSMDVNQGFLG